MKLTFEKSNLINAINIVSKAVSSKSTLPILECILIDASTDEIKMIANDLELGIETKVAGSILERGKIAVPSKLFGEIIRKLPDSDVEITTDSFNNMMIVCESANFKIPANSADEFSYLPYIEKENYICLSQFTLKELIRQTIFSIAANDNNKLMTGELFEINENMLRVVSLDGHRISIRRVKLNDSYAKKNVVVPGKTLNEISRILTGDNEKEVFLFFGENNIMFEFDDTKVVSRLIEGEYFNIDRMLSSDYTTKISLNKKRLLDCIERSMLLIRENDRKPIIMNITDDMALSMNSTFGTMNESIEIEKEGKDIMIGFNPKFFVDALKVIDDEEVTLYMINSKAPCFIRDDNEEYVYLILPVNFNNAG